MRRANLLLLLCAACSPEPAPVAPVPTVALSGAVAVPATASASVSVPAPASASVPAPAPAPSTPAPAPESAVCRGSSFDLAAIPEACTHHQRGEPPAENARLTVALVVDSPRVRSGDKVGVGVVFRNDTPDPLPVDVVAGCAFYELGAFDAQGKRRDYFTGMCPGGGGCGGSGARVVLEPGGTLTKHMTYEARVRKVTAASPCDPKDAGGLPPGKYTLRAMKTLGQWVTGAKEETPPGATAPLEVTR